MKKPLLANGTEVSFGETIYYKFEDRISIFCAEMLGQPWDFPITVYSVELADKATLKYKRGEWYLNFHEFDHHNEDILLSKFYPTPQALIKAEIKDIDKRLLEMSERFEKNKDSLRKMLDEPLP